MGPTNGPMGLILQGLKAGPSGKVGLKLRPKESPYGLNSKWTEQGMGPNIKRPLNQFISIFSMYWGFIKNMRFLVHVHLGWIWLTYLFICCDAVWLTSYEMLKASILIFYFLSLLPYSQLYYAPQFYHLLQVHIKHIIYPFVPKNTSICRYVCICKIICYIRNYESNP